MYQISVKNHFDAAHYLRGYHGKCERLHGHRFEVVVTLEAAVLNDIGIAYDFADLKQHLGAILDRFDHGNLNEIPPFDKINPSSENVAVTIYREMAKRFPEITVAKVDVWESPEAWVSYSP